MMFVGCSPATVGFEQTPIPRTLSLVLSITSPAPMTMARTGVTVQGICMSNVDVEVAGPGNVTTQVVPCVNKAFTAAVVFSAGDGLKTIQVSQFTRDTGLLVDSRDFLRDNTPPNLLITGPAANSLFQGAMTLVGTCESGFPVTVNGAGMAGSVVTACAGGLFSANITLSAPDGVKNIVATQTDGVGLTGSDNRNFIRDATPPAVNITSPAANSVFSLGFTLAGTCETGIPVTIAGAGASAPVTTACAAGSFSAAVSFSVLDGTKNFTATQTDPAGNVGTSNRNFVKDTTAPVITINAPAANTVGSTGLTLTGNCENGFAVVINGTGVASSTSVPCAAGNYTAPILFSAGDGAKSVTASQTDAVGNVGSASRNFIRDGAAPILAFTSPAANAYVVASATVQGTCEAGLSVTLAGAGLSASTSTGCAAGTFSQLVNFTAGDGNKVVTATQTDGAGNVGTANRTFIRDTTAPLVAITSPAANTAAQNGLTVGGTCETGLMVNLSGAGISGPVSTACAAGAFSAAITFSAGDGVKNIIASQTDGAGNTGSGNRNFVRDTIAPAVAITSPAANSNIAASVLVGGTCETGITVVLDGTGAAAPVNTPCAAGAFSASVNVTAVDGIKNITATQTDAAGNIGTDNRNFAKDLTGPVIAITSPAPNTVAQSGLTITGICEVGFPVDIGGTGSSASFQIACVGGAFTTPITFSAGDGVKNITAAQTDGAMNTTTDNRNFVKDTTAPAVAITSPANGSFVNGSATIVGTCETGINVTVNGAGVSVSVTTPCAAGSFSVPVSFTAGDGNKVVVASQIDAAGNTGSASRTYVRDGTAPAIAITAPAVGTSNSSGLTVSGTCETGLTVNISGTGVSAPSSTGCAAGAFSAAIIFSAGDGVKNVVASQTDLAGNIGSDNRNFARDSTGPLLAITGPAANSVHQSGLTLVGICETGLAVNISGGVSAPSSTPCVGSAFSAVLVFSVGDGVKNIAVSQTDGTGNTSTDNRNFVKDSIAPVITIASPLEGAYVGASATISGACETGITVNVSGSGVSAAVTTGCVGSAYSVSINFTAGDGNKNIVASQQDAAGNTGSATRNVVRDSIAPAIAITSPAANTPAVSGLTVGGTCETGLTVTMSGAGVSGSPTTMCAAGVFSVAINFSAGDGIKIVNASQTDPAGNTGTATRNFVRDSTAPLVAITSPSAGFNTNVNITVSGTCETGLTVDLTGAGIGAPTNTPCVAGGFTRAIVFSPGDGPKNIVASQTDVVGNTGTSNRTFNLDTTAPIVTITSPAAMAAVASTFVLAGTCETGLVVNIGGTGASSPSSTACAAGAYSASVNLSAGVGNKDFIVAQTDAAGNLGTAMRTFVANPFSGHETFIPNPVGSGLEKVDVMFVDDNSASMDPEQAALASKFPTFVSELSGIDWQVGITTTDVSIGIHGLRGTLLDLNGAPGKILLPTTPNGTTVFQNTIVRPETIGCIPLGTCPSGLEQPLKASIQAMDKQFTNNAGFFRVDADLAIVILTDENEMSDGRPGATLPQEVIDHARLLWPTKKLSVFTIGILPGDAGCFAIQAAQFGATASYATIPVDLALRTGGITESVCAPDYTSVVSAIGQRIVQLANSVQLARIPIAGSVVVSFTPAAAGITFTVSGDKVIFSAPPPIGTVVDVWYNY